MALKDIFRDKTLHEILNSVNADGSSVQACLDMAAVLDNRHFILPVLGVQGSGKSTLLNALCFEQPTLPIDADETTSVPVEIRGRSTGTSAAYIVFNDGNVREISPVQEELDKYASQSFNPGNRLGVKAIVLESDAPFLADGIVLVDLPGVGSLTPANQKTTLEYIRNASGLICMIRTNPTVTTSEARDITTHWKVKGDNTYFIQNVWADEGKKEAEEALAYNQSRIDEIAGKLNMTSRFDGGAAEFGIIPVNAYRFLKCRCEGKPYDGGYGPEKALELLDGLSRRWPRQMIDNAKGSLFRLIRQADDVIMERRRILTEDRDKAEDEIESVREADRKAVARFRELYDEINRMLYGLKSEISGVCESWKAEEGENLRNRMRELAYKGITDGARLNSAFSDYTKEAYDILKDQAEEAADRMTEEAKAKFNDLFKEGAFSDRLSDKFSLDCAAGGQSFQGEEGTRFRNFMSPLGGVGMGIAATVLLSNPVGLAVAGVAGAVAALLGSFFGGMVKKTLEDTQIEKIVKQVPELVDGFLSATADSLNGSIAEFIKRFGADFQVEYNRLKEDNAARYETNLSQSKKTAEEKAEAVKEIDAALLALSRFKAEAEASPF
ncbi:MAG: dynamin family protein [Deltaproteobacteria bacterium]|jgi:ABC-type Fe3+/spermidine/putrescine transport system ATPase subunit|nr:dynamin family protein [Deltaproteobacteria bacterium]